MREHCFAMMDSSRRTALLQDLAAGIVRRRLVLPVSILLDLVEPLGFLASQAALFAHPFIPLGRWREYVIALEDETSWKVLQGLVEGRDS
jgi:hypothetical protein